MTQPTTHAPLPAGMVACGPAHLDSRVHTIGAEWADHNGTGGIFGEWRNVLGQTVATTRRSFPSHANAMRYAANQLSLYDELCRLAAGGKRAAYGDDNR